MTNVDKHKNHGQTNNCRSKQNKSNWNQKVSSHKNPQKKCSKHMGHRTRTSDSILSTDSDIRFTRRKLGDSQKCGCAVIAGFLVALLLAGVFIYVGYEYLRPDPLPERVFRAKFRVSQGDQWSMDLADQKSLRFQHKARDYRERINLIIRRSDLRDGFEGTEILALDGTEAANELEILFNLRFEPFQTLVSAADLLAIFSEAFSTTNSKYFKNFVIDPASLTIKEVTGILEEVSVSASSPLGIQEGEEEEQASPNPQKPPRQCTHIRLGYCKSIGYNLTTYPNYLGHNNLEEVKADLITFRELVDAECFQQAFDFICRLLQPPCDIHEPLEPSPGKICREYCEAFKKGCGSRLPNRFKKYFDCESFPESIGFQSCHSQPDCSLGMQANAQSSRLCDGVADCPDLSDEATCSYCPPNYMYCGRGRACVPTTTRCDGKLDCPDGADEKNCLSIATMVSYLTNPPPRTPYLPRFFSEGFATFSEKGSIGKLCAEGLQDNTDIVIRQTVAESLCKSLGYKSLKSAEVRNDTEPTSDYVRVLDPHASEISFVRTNCQDKQALYVECGKLECGMQSVLSPKYGITLPKMAAPGDWPWLAALFREEAHVCDGTLVSSSWVLTTDSCFQGQPRASWLAVFGAVRLTANAPWSLRRRLVGMVKSPVEGSTAALVRLETPVIYSDFVRPVCLPDEARRESISDDYDQNSRNSHVPKAEKLQSEHHRISSQNSKVRKAQFEEDTRYFIAPSINGDNSDREDNVGGNEAAEALESIELMPKAEAFTQIEPYPLPEMAPQMEYYAQLPRNIVPQALPMSYLNAKKIEQSWSNCNTLAWSRQRDHLQRVQLRIGDMAACENISIATVNSMCTETTFQKNDCTEEEFAGSPVMCIIPGTSKWALIGIGSWRIACAPSGVERPRMYDKITSNSAWIHDTINSS